MDPKALIHQYLLGNLDEADVKKLDALLAEDAKLRREFRLAAEVDAALSQASIEHSIDMVNERSTSKALTHLRGYWVIAACVAIAASALFAVGFWNLKTGPVATLASSEDAAWESTLPTSPGSQLTAGTLNLKSGIATVRFHSGAEMVIEAPAQVELLTAMRAKLNSGTAVMEVPDSAIGFVLETPDGYAIDFGTRFAVNVDQSRNASNFELIEGEIEVHHPSSGESLRLNEVGTAASVSGDSMRFVEDPLLSDAIDVPTDEETRVIRIATKGRCGSAIRNDARRKKAIRPEYLYAKSSDGGKWDMRTFFEFDLTDIQRNELKSAKLRINQVPSYRGSASLLPRINRFALYGLTNPVKADWKIESAWDDSPGSEDGVLLGTFEILRSQQRGSIEVDTKELLKFLQDHDDRPVTLILVRETSRASGGGPAMTHMFASDKHPEAVGPLLELGIR